MEKWISSFWKFSLLLLSLGLKVSWYHMVPVSFSVEWDESSHDLFNNRLKWLYIAQCSCGFKQCCCICQLFHNLLQGRMRCWGNSSRSTLKLDNFEVESLTVRLHHTHKRTAYINGSQRPWQLDDFTSFQCQWLSLRFASHFYLISQHLKACAS